MVLEEAGAKLAQHRGIEARVVHLKRQQVFPVQPGADGISRLPIREVFRELEDGDEG